MQFGPGEFESNPDCQNHRSVSESTRARLRLKNADIHTMLKPIKNSRQGEGLHPGERSERRRKAFTALGPNRIRAAQRVVQAFIKSSSKAEICILSFSSTDMLRILLISNCQYAESAPEIKRSKGSQAFDCSSQRFAACFANCIVPASTASAILLGACSLRTKTRFDRAALATDPMSRLVSKQGVADSERIRARCSPPLPPRALFPRSSIVLLPSGLRLLPTVITPPLTVIEDARGATTASASHTASPRSCPLSASIVRVRERD
jgi:hypothetical protein